MAYWRTWVSQVPATSESGITRVDNVDFANVVLKSAPELVHQAISLTMFQGLLLVEAATRLKVSRFTLMRRLQAFYEGVRQGA